MNYDKLNNLLQQTNTLIKHQREKEELKGESFNVFSILKMESKENETHSAFLAELLDPKGSHLKGTRFLELFLQTIGNQTITLELAKVKVEHPIGRRDDQNKTGGRIDIYIWDGSGNSISIENKIYAKDQNCQVERYVNHNPGKNNVFYLTLEGNEPTESSKGELVPDKDFFLLSYRSDITAWLQKCFEASADHPILRESIRQYIILIKKLTNTMDQKEQEELDQLILRNYSEAKLIADNFYAASYKIKDKLRNKVIELLTDRLGNDYDILKGSAIDNRYAQIWIKPKACPDSRVHFGVESFSGKFDDNKTLFVGIVNLAASNSHRHAYWEQEDNSPVTNWWTNIQPLKYDDVQINMRSHTTLSSLIDQNFFNRIADEITSQICEYLDKETAPLLAFLEKQKALKEQPTP